MPGVEQLKRGEPSSPGFQWVQVTDIHTLSQLLREAVARPGPWVLEMVGGRVLAGEAGKLTFALWNDITGPKALERVFWNFLPGEGLLIDEKQPHPAQFELSRVHLPHFYQHMRKLRQWLGEKGWTAASTLRFSPDIQEDFAKNVPEAASLHALYKDLHRSEWPLIHVLDLFRELDSVILTRWIPAWIQAGWINIHPEKQGG